MSHLSENAKRIAVVLSHPTQYYSPWFRWMCRHSEVQFRVFYLWDFGISRQRDPHFGVTFEWDVDLLSGYESEVVPNVSKNPGAESFLGFNNPGLTTRLRAWRPDAILLFGYNWLSHMTVVLWATIHRIPIIFRGDSHLLGREKPPIYIRVALRLLYSRFAAFLFVGGANRDYFEFLGVPSKKLFFSPHSVNADLFDPNNRANQDASISLRLKLGIEAGTKVVLFAGKMVPAKQPMELLQAFLRLGLPKSALVLVGDGPEREAIQSTISGLNGIPDAPTVLLLPFANQSEMPALYLMSDIFVLPSRGVYETWGLAVNEAMSMGVPCIVSDRVGCQRDLVIQGETGWVFGSQDSAALEATLYKALMEFDSPSRRSELTHAVKAKISGYGYAQTTAGLVAAIAGLDGLNRS